MGSNLLPVKSDVSTVWERTMADVMDRTAVVAPAINTIRGTKITSPPPSFLPFLVYEYGLGELTPYIPNIYNLVNQGIDWQRLRGTPAAIALALGWLGYTAVVENESPSRIFWNLFQLHLDRVRDNRADLDRIAGVAQLSVPKRSVFWRGYSGLDIRPLTYGQSHYGEAHYGEYSGVRLKANGPLWSFGRSYEFVDTASQADLTELGVWTVPVGGADLDWGDFTWEDTEASWQSDAAVARSQSMASGVNGRPAWFVFFKANGDVIGYRRARAERIVEAALDAPYSVLGAGYKPIPGIGSIMYFECQTDFGEGYGSTAASVGLVFDAHPTDTTKPGLMWLTPGQISGGTDPVAVKAVDIVFGESVRERVKVLMRF